ncbi:MAG: 7-cyano-7-deazaguanine synthase, partial [Paludibacteraceae bacterium]|nr:7-cyano-7-deazaguanine synthase [Paludibacteraceae bacterium]
MKDSLLVLSGGMDSTTMLYEYQDRIALALSFHYGSNHNDKELAFAKLHCQRLGIEHIIIPLQFIKEHFNSSLLQGSEAIPEGNYDEQNMKSTVVPFRNGIMLAIAAGMAENRGLQYIMLANHSGDHTIYPDCRPEFVKAMDSADCAGTWNNVRLLTPYTNISKAEIARHGLQLG